MKVATIASVIGAVGVTTATGDSPTSAVGTSPGYFFTGTGTPATTTTSSAATTSTSTPQFQEFNSNDPDVMVFNQCVFKTGHYYCDDEAESEAQIYQEAVELDAEVRAAIAEPTGDGSDSDDEPILPADSDDDEDDEYDRYWQYGADGNRHSQHRPSRPSGGIARLGFQVPTLSVHDDCYELENRWVCQSMPIEDFFEALRNMPPPTEEEQLMQELSDALQNIGPIRLDRGNRQPQNQDECDSDGGDEVPNSCAIAKRDPTGTSTSAPRPTDPISDLGFEFNTADPTVRMHNSCFFSDGQFHCTDADNQEELQECALNQGAASEANVHFITGCESFFSDYAQCVRLSENDWACQSFSWEQLMQLEDEDIDDDEEMEMQKFEVIMENLASTINNLDVEDSDESPIASTHVTQGGAIETVAASIPDSEIKDTIRYFEVKPDSPYKLHQACILKNGAFYCTDEAMDAEDLYNSLSELKQANSDLTNVHVPIPTEFVNAHMNMPLEELDALTGNIFRHQTCIILADDWVCATKDQTGDASGADVANELPPVPTPTFTTSILPSGVAAPTDNSGLVARDSNSDKHSAAASGTGVYHASGTGAVHPSGTGAAYPSGSGVGSIDLPTSGAKQFGISLAGLLVAVLAL